MPKNTDATYIGAAVMEINGYEVEIISIKPKKHQLGVKWLKP